MTHITMIGAGNVAWQLSQGLAKAGHRIGAVYSRTAANASALAALFPDCSIASHTDFRQSDSSVFIVAVSDQALPGLMDSVLLPENAVIAHTSGSVSLEVLKRFPNAGVFYPLQTFTKQKETDLSEVPFGIEASGQETYEVLETLASSLSRNVRALSSAQRKIIHIAAVFACNFTNHLFSVSEEILKKENMEFELLKPLVRETIEKAFAIGPVSAQTGPAVRGDEKIIQQHLAYLKDEPELHTLYELLSDRIVAGKKKENKKD